MNILTDLDKFKKEATQGLREGKSLSKDILIARIDNLKEAIKSVFPRYCQMLWMKCPPKIKYDVFKRPVLPSIYHQ